LYCISWGEREGEETKGKGNDPNKAVLGKKKSGKKKKRVALSNQRPQTTTRKKTSKGGDSEAREGQMCGHLGQEKKN